MEQQALLIFLGYISVQVLRQSKLAVKLGVY
jgi:hypothetical protein